MTAAARIPVLPETSLEGPLTAQSPLNRWVFRAAAVSPRLRGPRGARPALRRRGGRPYRSFFQLALSLAQTASGRLKGSSPFDS